ncbi:MAG: hypothetical protein AAF402_00235 [Pseudomonadota bacterium]
MGKTLDHFGLGLSFVVAILYWHSFPEGQVHTLGSGFLNQGISVNSVAVYTIFVFLTQLFAFGNLIFNNPSPTVTISLRLLGWSLIIFGYVFFLYLSGNINVMELLNQPGGGVNRF